MEGGSNLEHMIRAEEEAMRDRMNRIQKEIREGLKMNEILVALKETTAGREPFQGGIGPDAPEERTCPVCYGGLRERRTVCPRCLGRKSIAIRGRSSV